MTAEVVPYTANRRAAYDTPCALSCDGNLAQLLQRIDERADSSSSDTVGAMAATATALSDFGAHWLWLDRLPERALFLLRLARQ